MLILRWDITPLDGMTFASRVASKRGIGRIGPQNIGLSEKVYGYAPFVAGSAPPADFSE
jgi:hypothetical protein